MFGETPLGIRNGLILCFYTWDDRQYFSEWFNSVHRRFCGIRNNKFLIRVENRRIIGGFDSYISETFPPDPELTQNITRSRESIFGRFPPFWKILSKTIFSHPENGANLCRFSVVFDGNLDQTSPHHGF